MTVIGCDRICPFCKYYPHFCNIFLNLMFHSSYITALMTTSPSTFILLTTLIHPNPLLQPVTSNRFRHLHNHNIQYYFQLGYIFLWARNGTSDTFFLPGSFWCPISMVLGGKFGLSNYQQKQQQTLP